KLRQVKLLSPKKEVTSVEPAGESQEEQPTEEPQEPSTTRSEPPEAIELPSSSHEAVRKSGKPKKRSRNQKEDEQKPKGKSGQKKAKEAKASHKKATEAKNSEIGDDEKPSEEEVNYFIESIYKVLEEYEGQHYTIEAPANFQINYYWKREAVGVKASKDLLAPSVGRKKPASKAASKTNAKAKKVYKSKNYSQIAYFALGGCIYTNMCLAGLFAEKMASIKGPLTKSVIAAYVECLKSAQQKVWEDERLFPKIPRSTKDKGGNQNE
ncbi:unnamed protein product, partial [Durusdinium trenchii]